MERSKETVPGLLVLEVLLRVYDMTPNTVLHKPRLAIAAIHSINSGSKEESNEDLRVGHRGEGDADDPTAVRMMRGRWALLDKIVGRCGGGATGAACRTCH
jgi:hypothetical protein